MKLKQYDIYLLLGSLLLFSCGIGFWHENKQKNVGAPIALLVDIENSPENSLEHFSNKDVINYLKPLTLSRSVEKIALVIKGVSQKRAVDILDLIFTHAELGLRRLDKKELILALVQLYPHDYDAFFEIFAGNADLHKGQPLLAIAARGMYAAVIPQILSWLDRNKNKAQNNRDAVKNMIALSYQYAVAHNEVDLVARMVQEGVPLSAQLATDLLWQLAEMKNSNSKIVPLLRAAGAQMNEARNKMTPLIQAVRNKNKDLVEALIKADVQLNTVVDNAVGSALQNAILARDLPIEQLLRYAGARE